MEKTEPTRDERKMASIKDRCARIEKVLASVAKTGTPVIPYLHDVGAIKRKATQELSHVNLAELDVRQVGSFSVNGTTTAAP